MTKVNIKELERKLKTRGKRTFNQFPFVFVKLSGQEEMQE